MFFGDAPTLNEEIAAMINRCPKRSWRMRQYYLGCWFGTCSFHIWNDHPLTYQYSSEGLQPPTSIPYYFNRQRGQICGNTSLARRAFEIFTIFHQSLVWEIRQMVVKFLLIVLSLEKMWFVWRTQPQIRKQLNSYDSNWRMIRMRSWSWANQWRKNTVQKDQKQDSCLIGWWRGLEMMKSAILFVHVCCAENTCGSGGSPVHGQGIIFFHPYEGPFVLPLIHNEHWGIVCADVGAQGVRELLVITWWFIPLSKWVSSP